MATIMKEATLKRIIELVARGLWISGESGGNEKRPPIARRSALYYGLKAGRRILHTC